MSRRAIRLTDDILVEADNTPVVLRGSIGLYSEDDSAVVFPTALLDTAAGPPVFTAEFINSLSHKHEPVASPDIDPELLTFDFSKTIPIRGWGLR